MSRMCAFQKIIIPRYLIYFLNIFSSTRLTDLNNSLYQLNMLNEMNPVNDDRSNDSNLDEWIEEITWKDGIILKVKVKNNEQQLIFLNNLFQMGLYGTNKLIFYPTVENPIGCYLSNNYVMIPYHCLDGEEDIIFNEKELDFAIIKGSEQKGCYPCSLHSNISLYAGIDEWNVKKLEMVNDVYAEIELSAKLQYGDSGMIVYGTASIQNEFSFETSIEYGQIPLFIIIARKKKNNNFGIAISLPYILYYIRMKDVELANIGRLQQLNNPQQQQHLIANLGMILKKLYENTWEEWEFISIPTNINNEYLKRTKAEIKVIKRKLRKNKIDKSVIQKLKNIDDVQLQNLADKYEKKLPTMKKWVVQLNKIFFIADLNVHDPDTTIPDTDNCWVLQYEREGSRSEGFYKLVSDFMEACNITNIKEEEHEGTVELYTGSTRRISMNKKCFQLFKEPIAQKDNTACHHPFLCELTKACRGEQCNKSGAPILTHCCIRPSHLVKMNKKFNDYCTVLQSFYAVGTELNVSWTTSSHATLTTTKKRKRSFTI